MGKVLTNEQNYIDIAAAIREKNGLDTKYKPAEMADAIAAIEVGGGSGDLPEEAYVISGDCNDRFANGGWDWFIREYGNKCKTSNISGAISMFDKCRNLTTIPIILDSFNTSSVNLNCMFNDCNNLTEVPKIRNCLIGNRANMFNDCWRIRYFPEDFAEGFDFTAMDNATGAYSFGSSSMFSFCYSLRKLPMNFINHGNPSADYSASIYYYLAPYCNALDEIVDLGYPHYNATYTNNAFSDSFVNNHRIKNMVFKLQNDGMPYVMKWKAQTIKMNYYVGYYSNYSNAINYGFTTATRITDDATYQSLKDNSDSWTTDINYSRYNHDSAVATINSLPDTSAYLATAGGTNTIIFKGEAGALTDGGAINTLTEEEIAVATAKGWTVSLV